MIDYRKNTVTEQKLKDFYYENNKNFLPNLSQQVDIDDYSRKIIKNAEIFEAWDSGSLIALVAAYFNDINNQNGFITSVIVSPEYNGHGIAKKLLTETINYAINKKYKYIKLEVHNDNNRAINLYKKFNFNKISINSNNFICMKHIVREK